MATSEEMGYQDAIRQVTRSFERHLKSLLESQKLLNEEPQTEGKAAASHDVSIRIAEVRHLLQVVESLHR